MSPTGTPSQILEASQFSYQPSAHSSLDLPTSDSFADLLSPIRESLGKNSTWLTPEEPADKVASLLLKRGQSSANIDNDQRDSWLGPSLAASRNASRPTSGARFSRPMSGAQFDKLAVPALSLNKRASITGSKRSSVVGSRRSSLLVPRRAASPMDFFDEDGQPREKVPLVVIDRRKYKRFSGTYRAMYFTDRRTTRDWLGIRGAAIEKPRNCLSKKVFQKSYNSVLWSGNQRTYVSSHLVSVMCLFDVSASTLSASTATCH
jgi:hypothetical protein